MQRERRLGEKLGWEDERKRQAKWNGEIEMAWNAKNFKNEQEIISENIFAVQIARRLSGWEWSGAKQRASSGTITHSTNSMATKNSSFSLEERKRENRVAFRPGALQNKATNCVQWTVSTLGAMAFK